MYEKVDKQYCLMFVVSNHIGSDKIIIAEMSGDQRGRNGIIHFVALFALRVRVIPESSHSLLIIYPLAKCNESVITGLSVSPSPFPHLKSPILQRR